MSETLRALEILSQAGNTGSIPIARFKFRDAETKGETVANQTVSLRLR